MANGNSTSLISAFIRNSGDFPVSTATNLISFGISGEGTLLGTTQKNAAAGRATVTMKSTINYGTAVVTATSDNLSGDDFTVITTSVSVPLSAPENLEISGTRHNITVTWTGGTNNVKYKVERKIAGGEYSTATDIDYYTQTTLNQNGLKAGTTYWFRVYGYNSTDEQSDYVEGSFMTEPVNELKKDTSGLAGTPEEKIEISIPPNTFNEDYYVQISTVSPVKTADADGKDNDIRLGVAGSGRQ